MKDCCEITADVTAHQRRVLRVVLAVNIAMFFIEFVGGLVACSTALLADSVDMLGDSIVYGFSLYVIGRGPLWESRGALLKGWIMAIFGAGVLVEAALKLARGAVPDDDIMSGVGLLALIANGSVLLFLRKRRADDINMRSSWLCSRNDVIANVGVLVAAGTVGLTGSAWPDIGMGLLIAALFVTSAGEVIRSARRSRVPSLTTAQ
jgi:cation diffusion facilitator family transporter